MNESNKNLPSSEKIFIVDDDQIQQIILTAMLESTDHIVETFDNAQIFLESCPPEQRGCVISDILMPGYTGFEMLEVFPKYGITMPVIFISGYANLEMAKTALRHGAIDFLEKPIKTPELLSAIQNALHRDAELQSIKTLVDQVSSSLRSLTVREREILNSLIAGNSKQQLASQLDISLQEIETHHNNILRQMGATTLIDLLRMLLSFQKVHIDLSLPR